MTSATDPFWVILEYLGNRKCYRHAVFAGTSGTPQNPVDTASIPLRTSVPELICRLNDPQGAPEHEEPTPRLDRTFLTGLRRGPKNEWVVYAAIEGSE
ncbi:hypothetical protein CRENBAI_020665 [Crenichthys baileyi]|uniref:Uncharacterized protein n=1 Tax=Crenichthys baileyi TaxID=28760 RepID=A0AAV9RZS9_9TELE